MTETERHEAVAVLVDLRLVEFAVLYALLLQDVIHFGHFGMEVQPPLRVVLHELAAPCLLRYDKEGAYLGELPSLEVPEIAFRQELRIFGYLVPVALLAENVLLLQGIALPKCLHHARKHVLKTQVLLCVRTQLLHGVGHLEYDRRLALGREEDDIAVRLLQLRVKSVKRSFPFLCHAFCFYGLRIRCL